MKIETRTSPVEIGGELTQPQEFKISASREAFRVLSDGLYSDKKLAIIRELSCNAYDSMVAAGKKDQPFEIHLPTDWEPYFSVKDNGTGLPHEDVINLYTTYFATTRSDSNNFVGALGLGSKSPFCYTETFTVTSRYNGITRIYSAFIAETGTPNILLQSEEETPDELNGVEVMFAVDKNDCWEFTNKAKIALEFFNPRPILNTEIDIVKQKYSTESASWGLRVNQHTHQTAGLRAIQGMVQYSVGNIDESRMTPEQARLAKLPIDIFFPIGKLSVAASRETLSKDDNTINNILAAIQEIYTNFVEEFKKKLASCETEWQARLLIFEAINTPGFGRIINEAHQNGIFKGTYSKFTLNEDTPKLNELDYDKICLYKFKNNYRSELAYKHKVFNMGDLERANAIKDIGSKIREKSQFELEILPSREERFEFVVNDLGFGIEKYIHYLVQRDDSNNKNTVYLFNRRNKNCTSADVIKESKKALTALGNPPFVYVSELKKKYASFLSQRTTSAPTKKKDLVFFDMKADCRKRREGYTVVGWRNSWKGITEDEVDFTKDRFYLTIDKQEPQFGGKAMYNFAEDVKKFIKNVEGTGLLGVTDKDIIYGLTLDNPLRKEKGWIEFTSHVFTELAKVMTPMKEIEIALQKESFDFHSSYMKSVYHKLIKKPILGPTHKVQQFFDLVQSSKKSKNEYALDCLIALVEKAKALNVYKSQKVNVVSLDKEWVKLKKEYPMFFLLDTYGYEDKINPCDTIIEYIKLVDKVRDEEANQEVISLAMNIVDTLQEKNNEEKEEVCTSNTSVN